MAKPRITTPRCPLRPQDPCSLCQPGVNGPQDCGLVYLVMDDPELRELYAAHLKARRARQRVCVRKCRSAFRASA